MFPTTFSKCTGYRISKSLLYFFLCSFAATAWIVFAVFQHLNVTPTPIQNVLTNGGEFSEARTKEFLSRLESLGPKLLGTGASEIGATALLISEVLKIPTVPVDENAWTIESGLSSPYMIFKNQHNGDFDSSGCVCPDALLETESAWTSIIENVHQRLKDTLLLCAPASILTTLGSNFEWIKRIRHALRIELNGCRSISDWGSAEMYLRYIKESYPIEFPIIPPSEIAKLIDADSLLPIRLQTLAAGAIAARSQLRPLLKSNICDATILDICTEGLASDRVFRIEQFTFHKMESELLDKLLFIDISLSHQYSGNFVIEIPKGEFLNNVYRNLTTLAVRLTPIDTILNNNQASIAMSQSFRDSKTRILREYEKLKIVPVVSSKSEIRKLAEYFPVSLTMSHFRKYSPPSLMLASHFDTAVSSPGGADAGVGISVALEVMRNVLHHKNTTFNRPLMLVLNGGEENVLPAAHGFVTQHPWIDDITEVLNLEAAGNWGNENLLRTGHHSQDLLKLYQRIIKLPHATSLSHEIFEAGLVPGLTDFQFYRDLAGLEGFDFAYSTGGYYYHTAMDQLQNIQEGSIQHYGNTVSALVFELLKKHQEPTTMTARQIRELKRLQPETHDGYFDILGRFMLIIPSRVLHSGFMVTIVILCISALVLNQYSYSRSLPIGALLRLLCTFGVSVGANAAFAYFLHRMGWGMCWFSDPRRIPLLYSPISIIIILESLRMTARSSVYCFVDQRKMEAENFLSVVIVWVALLILSVIYKSRGAYIPLILLMGAILGRFIGMIASSVFSVLQIIPIFTLIGHITSMFITVKPYISLIDHLGPVFGRVSDPPDVILSVLTTIFIFLIIPLVFYCPFSNIVFDRNVLLYTRFVLWFLYFPLCASFVLSHGPFTSITPQRADAIHFLSRYYGPNGELLRSESGLTLQATDSIGFSSMLLDRLENRIRPYWQSPVHGASHYDSFHNYNNDTNHHFTNDLKRFDILRDPDHTFLRYPQGAVFRKFASELIHVYPDLLPPFVDVNAEGLRLSDVPVSPNWDPSWQIKEPFFLIPNSSIPYSSRHQPPQLRWTSEPHTNGIIRIHVDLIGTQRSTVFIPAKQPVIAWSFSSQLIPPREECDCYGSLFGAGVASPMGYKFWVDFDTKQGNIFSIAISANYFDILTPPLKKVLEFEKELAAEKIFITTTTSVGELGFWRINVN